MLKFNLIVMASTMIVYKYIIRRKENEKNNQYGGCKSRDRKTQK